MTKKVVVTGLGVLNALGDDVEANWQSILHGASCINQVEGFDLSALNVKIAGQIKNTQLGGWFDIFKYDLKKFGRLSNFISYGIITADIAVKDSGLNFENLSENERYRYGVVVGSGIGGIDMIESSVVNVHTKGADRVTPFFIPGALINTLAGIISIRNGIKGLNTAVTTACASGNNAIGAGMQAIQRNEVDVMVVTGSESSMCLSGFAGFAAMRALSTKYNDNPTAASRPYDVDHDGFVMSEGSATLILEDYEHAKKRGAKIYAEITGYGSTGDAYHLTAPQENGKGAVKAMQLALQSAQLNITDIDYINLHGTSTPLGDAIELTAIKEVFGDHVSSLAASSTKSSTGHLLGAAGTLEAVYSILAIRDNTVPATINLYNPLIEAKGINLVPLIPQNRKVNTVLSNAFGFGGCNSCLVFKRLT